MYREEVEVQSNYEKSCLRWLKNVACGNSTGSSRIEKDKIFVPSSFVWRNGGGRSDGDLKCWGSL